MLVLSLFPGIGLLDQGFEAEGFCVVRGPDLLWGGDIRRFHPPAGRFEGVIGGPPCQAFSTLVHLVRATGRRVAPDLIPEFVRVVYEAQPAWFLMENVRDAPLPSIEGYIVDAPLLNNRWLGGEQSRLHRFSFGTRDGRKLIQFVNQSALECFDWSPRVLASGGYRPANLEGGNHSKTPEEARASRKPRGGRLPHDGRGNGGHARPGPWGRSRMAGLGWKTTAYFQEAKRLQGLPVDFDLPPFTVKAKVSALGDAVPLPMARELARAIKASLEARA